MRIIVFIFASVITCTVSVLSTPLIPPDNFADGWARSGATKRFLQNDLYGYINGGAEIFLELGFGELLVQHYSKDQQELSLEIYRMDSAESALGIYLHSCSDEKPVHGITSRNTGNVYQVTALKNNYYIRANNKGGDKAPITDLVNLLNIPLSQIEEGTPVELFSNLNKKNMVPGSEIIFRGPYALQSIYTFGEGDIFLQEAEIFGVGGDFPDTNGENYTHLVIHYPSQEHSIKALKYLETNLDNTIKILERKIDGFIFSDFRGLYGKVELSETLLEIQINLTSVPSFKSMKSSRVRRSDLLRLIPLTEPYVRFTYTAPVYFPLILQT
ncbi:MAG: hypothetical protein RAP03_20830, partial [Candidatus Electryonea clarkiae]|nr:hypothetical protein [Candidatus Electryonea clarkiae]